MRQFLFFALLIHCISCTSKEQHCFSISKGFRERICFENGTLGSDSLYESVFGKKGALVLFDPADSLLILVGIEKGTGSSSRTFSEIIRESWIHREVGPINRGNVNIILNEFKEGVCYAENRTIYSHINSSGGHNFVMELDYLKDDILLSIRYHLFCGTRDYDLSHFDSIVKKFDFDCSFLSCL